MFILILSYNNFQKILNFQSTNKNEILKSLNLLLMIIFCVGFFLIQMYLIYRYFIHSKHILLKEIKDKKEETSIKNYGMHPKKTEGVQAKYRQTCLERYNTDNTAKTIEVRDKIKETFIEKYGGHPMHNEIVKSKVRNTCLERYGCHPAQRSEIQEQIQKSGKTYKCYTMPSGEIRKIQGYEHFALDILVKEYTEEQIKSNRRDVPRILYESDNKQRYYFPDIYLPHVNLIIEVKSTWIYKKEEERNHIKAAAARAKGYQFEFWIFTNKGVRIQQ